MRGPALPDVPTVSEAGLPGFETAIWFGLNGPAALPDPIRDRLAAAVDKALRTDTVSKAFRVQGIEPLPSGPADYARYIATETTKWSDVVVQAGLVK